MKKKEGCIIMKATERFYLCEHCGNMAGLIHDAGVPMMCCGQPMKHLVAEYYRCSYRKARSGSYHRRQHFKSACW